MTDDEWGEIETEAKGLWGTSNRELVDQRLATWRKRWKGELRPTMTAALRILEHSAEHWPSVKAVHAAVDEVKARFRPVRQSEGREPDAPLSPRQLAEMAAALVAAANDRVVSGRGREGDRWHSYLFTLAEFYEANAARLRAGDAPEWPPPRFGGLPVLARVLEGAAPVAARLAGAPLASAWDEGDAA